MCGCLQPAGPSRPIHLLFDPKQRRRPQHRRRAGSAPGALRGCMLSNWCLSAPCLHLKFRRCRSAHLDPITGCANSSRRHPVQDNSHPATPIGPPAVTTEPNVAPCLKLDSRLCAPSEACFGPFHLCAVLASEFQRRSMCPKDVVHICLVPFDRFCQLAPNRFSHSHSGLEVGCLWYE